MKETATIQQIRENMLDLLQEHFISLKSQCQMCITIQEKIQNQLLNNEKVDRDFMYMLTNMRGQIQETISVILPLLKENIKPPQPMITDDKENYQITDPQKRKTINELREYIKTILAKDAESRPISNDNDFIVQKVLDRLNAENQE